MVTLNKHNKIEIFTQDSALFQHAADIFMQTTCEKVVAGKLASVVLSGGNTPKNLFKLLSTNEPYKSKIPWQKIQFFFGDERYVPADNLASNYHTAYEYLFKKLPIPKEHIFRIRTDFSAASEAASAYTTTIRQALNLKESEQPKFDLIYLGLGDNAHTASLMPHTELVTTYSKTTINTTEQQQIVAALWVAELDMYRITLTPPAINNSQQIVFLVTGSDKALAVKNVLQTTYQPTQYPAQLIHSNTKNTYWLLDEAAAQQLAKEST